MYLNDIFTVTVNLAGLPRPQPAGGPVRPRVCPLGLQLIGRPLEEGTLFSLAGALEKAAGFSGQAGDSGGGAEWRPKFSARVPKSRHVMPVDQMTKGRSKVASHLDAGRRPCRGP